MKMAQVMIIKDNSTRKNKTTNTLSKMKNKITMIRSIKVTTTRTLTTNKINNKHNL